VTLIYLVRHGETDWNKQRRIQGSTDIPLNETGREQARATGRILARRTWDRVVGSSLSRALETASIIADAVSLPAPEAIPELVERRYGEAEGMRWPEIDARFPGDTPVPGREKREEVVERAVPALLALAVAHPGEAIIAVSHGGLIRAVLSAVDPDHDHGPIGNGSIHSFRVADGSLELIAFDDPIDELARDLGADDIADQNALEGRDAAIA
jgi:probable phosphoglycerate mutase